MKIAIRLVCFFVLTSMAAAQEPTPMPKDYREELSRYVGDWTTEVTVDGETLNGTFSARWTPGGECFAYQLVAPGIISTDTIIHSTGLIGWNSATGQTKEVNFNSLGETGTTLWTLDDGILKGKREGTILGQPFTANVENVWSDDGTWTHKVTDRLMAGEPQEDISIHMTRKEFTAIPSELKEFITAHAVGDWDVEITFGDETIKGTASSRWSEHETVVFIEEASTDTSGMTHIAGIWGWEGDTGSIVHRGFLSRGDHFSIRWTELDDEKWSGHVNQTFMGVPESSPTSIDWHDDGFTYRDKTDGKDFIYRATRR